MGKSQLLTYNSIFPILTSFYYTGFQFLTGNSMKYAENIQADKDLILTEAGRCVACGLCLPHCPTYQLTQVEAESPRGRISLISALASGDLEASDTLERLLHNCLLCRACENMCPSSVSFSMLMDKGRYLLKHSQKKTSFKSFTSNKVIDFLFRHPEWIRIAAQLTTPISTLSRNKTGRSGKHRQTERTVLDYLPSIKPHKRWENKYLVENSDKQVSLFLGCVSRSMDGETLDDAIYVLNKLGYSVTVPAGQVCCGALSLHAGREKESLQMMQKNIQAFENTPASPIIHTASGCGVSLGKYHDYLPDAGFSTRLNEICQFIVSHWPGQVNDASPTMKVLLHTPCSLGKKPVTDTAPYRMLSKFVKLELHTSISTYHCCGASGTKMLVDFDTSNALRDPVLNQIKIEQPDIVVSSNIGCVKHPVSLVADILRENRQD
jgi:glycolate oxidase iron-sulfur subunit